jgi:hypothetical protein
MPQCSLLAYIYYFGPSFGWQLRYKNLLLQWSLLPNIGPREGGGEVDKCKHSWTMAQWSERIVLRTGFLVPGSILIAALRIIL